MLVVPAVVVAAAVLPVSARARREAASLDSAGVLHLHGVGVNAKDGAFDVATHTGLFPSDYGE